MAHEPAGRLIRGLERLLEPSGSPDKGKEGNMARALDRSGQRALVFGTGAGLAARLNLATLGNVTAEMREVLIVDLFDAIHTKGANLAARAEAATAEAPSAARTFAVTTGAVRAWAARTKAAGALSAVGGSG